MNFSTSNQQLLIKKPSTMDLVSRYLKKLSTINTMVKFHNVCDNTPSGRVDRTF